MILSLPIIKSFLADISGGGAPISCGTFVDCVDGVDHTFTVSPVFVDLSAIGGTSSVVMNLTSNHYEGGFTVDCFKGGGTMLSMCLTEPAADHFVLSFIDSDTNNLIAVYETDVWDNTAGNTNTLTKSCGVLDCTWPDTLTALNNPP